MTEIGERIKALIDELGISQRQFAYRISINPATISKIVQGKIIPNNRIIILITNVFNVSKKWLETGEGDIFSGESTNPIKKDIFDMIDNLDEEQVETLAKFMKCFFYN